MWTLNQIIYKIFMQIHQLAYTALLNFVVYLHNSPDHINMQQSDSTGVILTVVNAT